MVLTARSLQNKSVLQTLAAPRIAVKYLLCFIVNKISLPFKNSTEREKTSLDTDMYEGKQSCNSTGSQQNLAE